MVSLQLSPRPIALDHPVGCQQAVGQGAVIVIYAPTQHFLSIFQNQPLMGRVVGKIVKFLRVCF